MEFNYVYFLTNDDEKKEKSICCCINSEKRLNEKIQKYQRGHRALTLQKASSKNSTDARNPPFHTQSQTLQRFFTKQ